MNKEYILHEMKAIAQMQVSSDWYDKHICEVKTIVKIRKKLFNRTNMLIDELFDKVYHE